MYITAKTDWDTDDLIQDSDMNRIEGNIVANRKRYEVSGTCGGQAAGVSTYIMYQKGYFSVEDDEEIVLKNARFIISNSALRLRIRVDTGGGLSTVWTSTAEEGDVEPDEIIYSNTTGSAVTGNFEIQIYNSGGGSPASQYFDSWHLTIEKEEVEVTS